MTGARATMKRRPPPPHVSFNPNPFRQKHGHLPRGDALWIFYFNTAPADPWIPRDASGQLVRCSYLEAKRLASLYAKSIGAKAARVDPDPL